MTPNEKTKFKDQAQTRALSVFSSNHEAKRIDTDSYVEGYAARYEPYVLYNYSICSCIGTKTPTFKNII